VRLKKMAHGHKTEHRLRVRAHVVLHAARGRSNARIARETGLHLACRLPAESGVPLARWSCPELARKAVRRGIAAFVSSSTVRRWLTEDAIKPWQHRSWILITDPGFRLKAARVLDLYARTAGRTAGR
jgi:hypothetical protein